VIGGLICSTVATLLFVPAVFRLVHERKPSRASEPAPTLHIEAKPI
jgi:Cu/Ag efflux pump CusA